MSRVETRELKGKRIVVIDLSQTTPAQMMEVLPEAHRAIAAQPLKGALVLTDVTGALYNKESADAMKAYTKSNSPFMKRSAVVGADGLRAVLLAAIRVFTGRELRNFSSRDEAMSWLVE